MQTRTIDFSSTKQFSSLFLDYISQKESLKEFYEFSPDLDGIKEAIKKRNFDFTKRLVLVEELKAQYLHIETSEETHSNIISLTDENTFTITCGHQLNLFTGPLYFIYKIISCIKLCEQLKAAMPQYNFVPVYWMASEDHDFAEINHFTLFGKSYSLDLENIKGAVGKINCSLFSDFLDQLPNEVQPFTKFYRESETLADATAKLVNHIFGKYGLVVLNPDVKNLRAEFKSYFLKEVTERKSFELLQQTSTKLENLGYKSQISGREINLMYADTNLRERIVLEQGRYNVLNSNITFDLEELTKLIDEEPVKLSTNVVLRPVYQEVILPNLAFIGGPAEVVYWLQLKPVFEYFEVNMPVILPRNFGMVIQKNQIQKLEKYQISVEDLFLTEHELKQKIAANDLILSFDDEVALLNQLGKLLEEKANLVDKSLVSTVAAEHTKLLKSLDDIQKRLQKGLEKRNLDGIGQIINIKNKLFPNGSPQERVDNFLNFYLNDPEFIQKLYNNFEPLLLKYYIFE
jgi:bacillithiol synthase